MRRATVRNEIGCASRLPAILPIARTAAGVGDRDDVNVVFSNSVRHFVGEALHSPFPAWPLAVRWRPISGCSRICSIARVTASNNLPPHPGRRCSYHRIASVSSSEAGPLIRNGFTDRGSLARSVASLLTRVQAGPFQLRSQRCDAQSRHPMPLRRWGQLGRPGWRGAPRQARRASQARGAMRRRTPIGQLSTWRDLTPTLPANKRVIYVRVFFKSIRSPIRIPLETCLPLPGIERASTR